MDPIRRRAVHVISRLITRCWHEIEKQSLQQVLDEFAESLQTEYKQAYVAHSYQIQESIRSQVRSVLLQFVCLTLLLCLQHMSALSSSIRMFMRAPMPKEGNGVDPHLMADRANAIAEEITLLEQQEFRLIKAQRWIPLMHPDGVPPSDELVKLAMMPISWFVRVRKPKGFVDRVL